MIPGTAAVLSSYPPPVRCRLLGTQLLTNGAGSTSWNFGAFNAGGNGLGTTTQKKQIVVVAYAASGVLSNIINSMTIGGVSATSVSSVSNNTVNTNLRIMKAAITATTGNIVVASGGGVVEVEIAVYEVLNADTTVLDNEFSYDQPSPFGVNIDSKAEGCIIAAAMIAMSSGATTFTWSGATKDLERSVASNTRAYTFASAKNTILNGVQAVTTTVNGAVGVAAGNSAMIAASFRPLQ